MNLAGCFLLLSSNQPTIERIDFPWCSHVDSSNANNTAIIKSNQYAYGCSHHQATSATYVHCISGQLVAVDIHYSNDIVEKCITTHNLLFTIECKRIIIKEEKKQRRHEINIINRYQRNRTTTTKKIIWPSEWSHVHAHLLSAHIQMNPTSLMQCMQWWNMHKNKWINIKLVTHTMQSIVTIGKCITNQTKNRQQWQQQQPKNTTLTMFQFSIAASVQKWGLPIFAFSDQKFLMHQFFCFCFIRATLLHLVPHDLNGIVNRVRAIRYMQKRSKRNQPPSANSAYAGLDRATGAFVFTYEPRSRAIDSAESFRNVVCVLCSVQCAETFGAHWPWFHIVIFHVHSVLCVWGDRNSDVSFSKNAYFQWIHYIEQHNDDLVSERLES